MAENRNENENFASLKREMINRCKWLYASRWQLIINCFFPSHASGIAAVVVALKRRENIFQLKFLNRMDAAEPCMVISIVKCVHRQFLWWHINKLSRRQFLKSLKEKSIHESKCENDKV